MENLRIRPLVNGSIEEIREYLLKGGKKYGNEGEERSGGCGF